MERGPCEDELTLRDLYLILRAKRRLFWELFLGIFLLGALLAWFWPRPYVSQAVYAYQPPTAGTEGPKLAGQQAGGGGAWSLELKTPPDALVEGLKVSLAASSLERSVRESARVHWDAKREKLTLEARASSPELARDRARAVADFADAYFKKATARLLTERLRQRQEELRARRRALAARLQAAEAALKDLGRAGAAAFRSAEAQGGYENLLVELARLRIERADLDAELAYVNELLSDPETTQRVATYFDPFVRVADPNLPSEPAGMGRGVLLGLIFFLALFLALFGVFLVAAIEPPDARTG